MLCDSNSGQFPESRSSILLQVAWIGFAFVSLYISELLDGKVFSDVQFTISSFLSTNFFVDTDKQESLVASTVVTRDKIKRRFKF